jgi:hypothetical protein
MRCPRASLVRGASSIKALHLRASGDGPGRLARQPKDTPTLHTLQQRHPPAGAPGDRRWWTMGGGAVVGRGGPEERDLTQRTRQRKGKKRRKKQRVCIYSTVHTYIHTYIEPGLRPPAPPPHAAQSTHGHVSLVPGAVDVPIQLTGSTL